MSALPKTMKAAVLTELKAPLRIAELTMPETLAVGQVLVKIHFSGICGSQLGEIDGAKGEDKYLPHLLGHEASGTVVAVGAGVKYVKPDNKVVLHWRKGAGIEGDPPVYHWDGKRVNAGWITTFNEYAIVAENRVTPIQDDSDLEVASLFGCAVTTSFGVVENNARVRIGESVVVFGAGGIGLSVIQAAALVSANPIIAVDIFDNRLELARQMGATHVINGKTANVREEIKKIIEGAGVDEDDTAATTDVDFEEALKGVTDNAAKALGLYDRGLLTPGMRADIALWNTGRPGDLAYPLGFNPLAAVIHNGELVRGIL